MLKSKREPNELRLFEREGVICHPFHELLSDLSRRSDHKFSGSAGWDFVEQETGPKLRHQLVSGKR